MKIDPELLKSISDASSATPDPERAERNLRRLFEFNPHTALPLQHLPEIARLFSASQFLANFCIAHPEELVSAINERGLRITKTLVAKRAEEELGMIEEMDIAGIMKRLRVFKKRYLLRVTLRYLLGDTDIKGSMDELTSLAEVLISIALKCSTANIQRRYGEPSDKRMALIGLGKLGAEELNYSSDIDIIALYGRRGGSTSGILTAFGVRTNRISNHEFYSRTVELWSRLLSSHTEEGIVYRVDLRLRPQGQKGELILPLEAYRTYYESWGRTWERMVLIRARPVAGDVEIGRAFMEDIKPFLWRRTLDYSEIEEIRGLKKKIDSTITHDDIKRGYGGIREAEFFIHTFQLIYGAENESLRTNNTLRALHALREMNIIPDEDIHILFENYLFLRRIEHLLQMREDLQTHRLPISDNEIEALSKEMGFLSREGFLKNLRLRRMQIKNMYNSLLGTTEDVHAEALNLLEGDLSDEELKGYLSFRKVQDIERCLKNLKGISEHMSLFRTMKERSIVRKVIPPLLENALSAEAPDRAIAGIESLLTTYGIKTAHLTAIMEQEELMKGIIKIFSLSPYLTRIFLSDQIYLDLLIEEWRIMKTLRMLLESLKRKIKRGGALGSSLACYRRFEEVRIGIFFLLDILKTNDLFRGLSHLAEAIIRVIVDMLGCDGLSVIALGKLGGREMNFGSDIDIIFLSEGLEGMTHAERIMRALTTYTDNGIIYDVDARLRPDGSKGVLVNNIEGYKNYYLRKAHQWEIQALLKARPVAGDGRLGKAFIEMARDVIVKRGREIRQEGLLEMRDRIIRELSRESEGMDIKLGPGGIEEIEFYVQFKQLNHAWKAPRILVQNTLIAINRLAKEGLLNPAEAEKLYNTYKYYRKVEAFLRLNEESTLTEETMTTQLTAMFMGHKDKREFLSHLRSIREETQRLTRPSVY
jgi:glutamate-ammonia-ligase adenylyltransferase